MKGIFALLCLQFRFTVWFVIDQLLTLSILATLNRFASLVNDDGTEDKEETVRGIYFGQKINTNYFINQLDDDNDLQLTGPVTYSLGI
jgi:hypothetical protein